MYTNEVREALGSLYDPIRLAQAGICERFPSVAGRADMRERAQAMRGILLDAIESLEPPSLSLPANPVARGYVLLALHYGQGIALADAAAELGVSSRQAYRDLSVAVDRLTEYLAHLATKMSRPGPVTSEKPVEEELDRLAFAAGEVNVPQTTREALELAGPLVAQLGVKLEVAIEPHMPAAVAEKALLRHLLVTALGLAAKHASPQPVDVRVAHRNGKAIIRLSYSPAQAVPAASLEQLAKLASRQSVHFVSRQDETNNVEWYLTVPTVRRRTVLVIEDNAGVVELYRRMLGDTRTYEVVAAPALGEAVASAESVEPDIIILDVLMPIEDGWTVLRRLRDNTKTRAIPVLVCSVFGEKELATSLGASACITKPVTQEALLHALDACLEGCEPTPPDS